MSYVSTVARAVPASGNNPARSTATLPAPKRVFIADPVCVLPYGHNPTGIRAFNATLSRYFRETIPLVCAKLPPDVEMPKGTGRMFGFYYPAQIKLPGNVQPGKLRKALLRDWRKAINGARRFAAKNLRLPLAEDPMRWQARNDWKKIFARYSLSATDVIFFPSGDYYGIRGLLHFLETKPFRQWPAIHIHLINVMEHGSALREDAAQALYSDLIASGVVGRRLFVSAEAPSYAKFLTNALMSDVTDFPFPPLVEPLPLVPKTDFIVAAIGSGRGDKGYFRLADIAEKYPILFPDDRVRFHIQGMSPEHPEFNADYEARLDALENVRKEPHRLSSDAMHAFYAKADLLLLPYCRHTYQLRGSAVMSEGYGYGRPMLASRGTAFEEIINRYGNGRTCATNIEFCQAIHERYIMPKSALEAEANQGRQAFLADYERKVHLICKRLIEAADGNAIISSPRFES